MVVVRCGRCPSSAVVDDDHHWEGEEILRQISHEPGCPNDSQGVEGQQP